MNFTPRWFTIIYMMFSLVSCSKFESEASMSEQALILNPSTSTRVSISSVTSYLKAKNRLIQTKADNNLEIIPITSSENDTLLYIIRYSDGWEIISGDKRTPAILASSEKGNILQGNEAQRLWIERMAEDIQAIRKSTNEELIFSNEEIAANIAIWDGPDTPIDSINTGNPADGRYELYSISYTYQSDEQVGHMMATQWTQNHPYNEYVPLVHPDSSSRCPAGCTSVAAAQVLYYLQSKYGVPSGFYTSASCVGFQRNFVQNFSNWNTQVWENMNTMYGDDNNHYAAILIANAGKLTKTQYDSEGSSTILNPLPHFFNEYGYSCSHGMYDEAVVRTSLFNQQPVIIMALSEGIAGIPNVFSGHTFVIDGYSKIRQVSECLYKWFDPVIGDYDNSAHPDYTELVIGQPQITRVKMNWGWWTQWRRGMDINGVYHNIENDGWYYLTGDWTTTQGTYSSPMLMTYNFEVLCSNT